MKMLMVEMVDSKVAQPVAESPAKRLGKAKAKAKPKADARGRLKRKGAILEESLELLEEAL
eukprot:8151147-Alexandrium_andersonii.AAC.1